MKFLILPNSFKGTLSASSFCRIAQKILPDAVSLPISDGGDGALEVFSSFHKDAKTLHVNALNALGKNKRAPFLFLKSKKTAVLECAKITPLAGLKKSELDIINATSFGIGQVIKEAVKKGARNFFIGLGGVAFNDAGAGMAQALGFELLDAQNKPLKRGAGALCGLKKIARAKAKALPKDLKLFALCDVTNPLLGAQGSAAVYGPQKGASKQDVKNLERALTHLSKIVKRDLSVNINCRRCGASGALGAGLKGFLNAKLLDGASTILRQSGAEQKIKEAYCVIAAEGKLDKLTFYGKAPQRVCALAVRHKKPVIFICAVNEIKDKNLLKKHNIVKVIELRPLAKNMRDCKDNAAKYLKQALKNVRRDF